MRFLQILSPIMVDLYKFAWLKFISSKFARLNLQWIASLLFSSGFSLKIMAQVMLRETIDKSRTKIATWHANFPTLPLFYLIKPPRSHSPPPTKMKNKKPLETWKHHGIKRNGFNFEKRTLKLKLNNLN